MKVSIIDNYDSFTYNLVHYLEDITGERPFVCMNDQVNWDELESSTHIILSPGPGLPNDSGDLMKVIGACYPEKNILGVCLGMQAVGEFFGAKLKNLDQVQHGVQSRIYIEDAGRQGLYKNISGMIEVGRYHSWVVDEEGLPDELVITSRDEKGNIMSFYHQGYPVYGVQYHPESIMTIYGKQILINWLNANSQEVLPVSSIKGKH